MNKWEHVEEFPGYVVTFEGDVYNEETNRYLKASPGSGGHMAVSLWKDGRFFRRAVAPLVAKAFIPVPREDFNTPIHLDGSYFNCAASNLMWRTRPFAIAYHKEKSIRPFPQWDKKLQQVDTGEIFDDIVVPAERYGLLQKHIFIAAVNEEEVFPAGVAFRFFK